MMLRSRYVCFLWCLGNAGGDVGDVEWRSAEVVFVLVSAVCVVGKSWAALLFSPLLTGFFLF